MDVGAYVLGVLDDADMDRFERHLAACATCSRQLDELGVIGPILAELRQAGAPGLRDGPMLDRLLGQVAAERRTRHRRRVLASVAAAVLVVAGPVAAVVATEELRPPVVQSAGSERTATDPASGVRATVRMTTRPWGTEVGLKLTGAKGPLTCRLVAVGKSGRQQTVANWWVPEYGYGAGTKAGEGDSDDGLSVQGSMAAAPSAIARFEVITSTGRQLVSVPV